MHTLLREHEIEAAEALEGTSPAAQEETTSDV
jgi:hypothetical protein